MLRAGRANYNIPREEGSVCELCAYRAPLGKGYALLLLSSALLSLLSIALSNIYACPLLTSLCPNEQKLSPILESGRGVRDDE